MNRRDANDIKAPDGYVLGGRRRVRKDGTILFNRGWWAIPADMHDIFVGQDVWVHENVPWAHGDDITLDVAHPGLHIFEAQGMHPPMTVTAVRSERPDAKPGVRLQWRKDYLAR